MVEHEYYQSYRHTESLGGNAALREYCRHENVSPYEVSNGNTRSLREIVSDAGLRVAVHAELLPARAWYATRDFFRAHVDKDGRIMAKFPWTNKEITTEAGQLTHFLAEETAPIPESVINNMLTIAKRSSDLQSQILVGQIEQNQQLFKANIEGFIQKYPNLALLNMGITSLLVISGMHPEYLPALAPLGLGIAQATVVERSRICCTAL